MKLIILLFIGLVISFFGLLIYFISVDSKVSKQTVLVISTPTPLYDPNDKLDAEKLWTDVNNWRISEGFKPFVKDEWLCKLASERVKEIQTNYSHDGFSGPRFCPRGCKKVGENLVIGGYNQDDLDRWLASPGHRANLEYPYDYSCIATDNGAYAVQIFATY